MFMSENDVAEWEMSHQKHHHVASLELSHKLYNCPLFEKLFIRNLLRVCVLGHIIVDIYIEEKKFEKFRVLLNVLQNKILFYA